MTDNVEPASLPGEQLFIQFACWTASWPSLCMVPMSREPIRVRSTVVHTVPLFRLERSVELKVISFSTEAAIVHVCQECNGLYASLSETRRTRYS